MAYYVINDDKCLFEGMTKEEILTAITQAISTHTISDVDTGFVTTIKEKNKNAPLSFWVGTTAEYNAISQKEQNTFYILTDDDDIEQLETAIEQLQSAVETVQAAVNKINGKNGQTLLRSTVPFGTCDIAFVGDYEIKDFTVVAVDDFLCKIVQMPNNQALIFGTGTMCSAGFSITNFELTVDTQSNKLINNNSQTITILNGEIGSITQRAIDKIVGVC